MTGAADGAGRAMSAGGGTSARRGLTPEERRTRALQSKMRVVAPMAETYRRVLAANHKYSREAQFNLPGATAESNTRARRRRDDGPRDWGDAEVVRLLDGCRRIGTAAWHDLATLWHDSHWARDIRHPRHLREAYEALVHGRYDYNNRMTHIHELDDPSSSDSDANDETVGSLLRRRRRARGENRGQAKLRGQGRGRGRVPAQGRGGGRVQGTRPHCALRLLAGCFRVSVHPAAHTHALVARAQRGGM